MKRRNTELKNFVGLFSYYMNKRSTGDANSCEIKIVAGGHALGAQNVTSNILCSKTISESNKNNEKIVCFVN